MGGRSLKRRLWSTVESSLQRVVDAETQLRNPRPLVHGPCRRLSSELSHRRRHRGFGAWWAAAVLSSGVQLSWGHVSGGLVHTRPGQEVLRWAVETTVGRLPARQTPGFQPRQRPGILAQGRLPGSRHGNGRRVLDSAGGAWPSGHLRVSHGGLWRLGARDRGVLEDYQESRVHS